MTSSDRDEPGSERRQWDRQMGEFPSGVLLSYLRGGPEDGLVMDPPHITEGLPEVGARGCFSGSYYCLTEITPDGMFWDHEDPQPHGSRGQDQSMNHHLSPPRHDGDKV